MTEPVHDPSYWLGRLKKAQEVGVLHHAIFRCPSDLWERIAAKHREILSTLVRDQASVLDCGCGWGRLLDLLPRTWCGEYLGIDLSPAFIELAKKYYADQSPLTSPFRKINWAVDDLRNVGEYVRVDMTYDWAVLISMRPMIVRNQGQTMWAEVEEAIRRVSKRVLYLEYDPSSDGVVE